MSIIVWCSSSPTGSQSSGSLLWKLIARKILRSSPNPTETNESKIQGLVGEGRWRVICVLINPAGNSDIQQV